MNFLPIYCDRFGRKNFPNILNLVDDIQGVAKRRDITPGQVTLAWILAQGNNIIPIPGTKKIASERKHWRGQGQIERRRSGRSTGKGGEG